MIGQPALASPVLYHDAPVSHHGESGDYYRAILQSLHWPTSPKEAEDAVRLNTGDGNETTAAIRTLGVTSCARGEGVSTVAAHLAATAAAMEAGGILLVDANLTNPAVHDLFNVDAGPGVAEAAENIKAIEAYIQPSGQHHLELLTAGGRHGKSRAAMREAPGVDAVIAAVRQAYCLIVVDLPPTSGESAALQLAGLLDAVILVVEAERVSRDVARRAKELLQRAGANVRGAVLNKRRDYVPRWFYGSL